MKKNLPCKKELTAAIKVSNHVRAHSSAETQATAPYFNPRAPKKPVVNMDLQALSAAGNQSLIH